MNKTSVYIAAVAATVAILLAACGDDEMSDEERFTAAKLADANMIVSRENAKLNAKGWARSNAPTYEQLAFDSDSTISAQCLMGDGWASGDVVMPDGTTIGLKCQTTGSGKGDSGCLLTGDFMSKDVFSAQEGTCDEALRTSDSDAMPKLGS